MIPTIFFQLDNWANDVLMIVAGIFLVGCAILAAEIWLWVIAEIGIAIYERLYHRLLTLSV